MSDFKWMLASDLHIPYHNKRWVDGWLDAIRWWQPDVVDILGDLDDACPVSRFSDGRPNEIEDAVVTYAPLVKKFFEDLREIVPDAEIHYATGNHEARYDDYIEKKAPALRGLITPELLWGTDSTGVSLSYYSDPPVHRYGDIFVHHGPYAAAKGGESVRKVLDDFNVSATVGHSHRQAYVAKSFPLAGRELRGYELGHMTDIYSSGMGYDMKHDWQGGFGYAHVVNDHPHVSLVGIRDNAFVLDGKVFKN